MSKITNNLLNYLIQNRIIDENSANQISNELKDSNDTLGDILIKNGFFAKEDLLILIIEFYKKVTYL